MKITSDKIKKLKPCRNRFDNYLKFYKDKKFTKAQFMGLKNITHDDKLWVAFRLIPKDTLRLASADIAELVLPIFETKHPNDLRPRLAIRAARAKVGYGYKDAAYSASAATRDAAVVAYNDYGGVCAASFVAGAAASAANVACYSDDAFARATDAFTNAAYVADYAGLTKATAASNKEALKKQIRTIVLRYWK